MNESSAKNATSRSLMMGALIVLLLAGLPLAVWLDLTNLAEANLRRQAVDLNSVISSVRAYYAEWGRRMKRSASSPFADAA